MNAADERHGTRAGALAHRKDGERPCDRCLVADAAYIRKSNHLARNRALNALARNHHDEFIALYIIEVNKIGVIEVNK